MNTAKEIQANGSSLDPRLLTDIYLEADPLFARATEIGERVLGPGHPTVIGWLSNRATLLQSQVRSIFYLCLLAQVPVVDECEKDTDDAPLDPVSAGQMR